MRIIKARKRPVEIECMIWDGDNWDDLEKWCPYGLVYDYPASRKTISIDTLEGKMTVQLGDYIIKGVKGEFYPCKPDIFEKTYEIIGESNDPRRTHLT